jgi:hypothetical protein
VTCTASDGDELGQLLGVHMRRLSRTRLRVARGHKGGGQQQRADERLQTQHLAVLQQARMRKYQRGDGESEALLQRLWSAVFGDAPFEAVSPRWNDFGFQV